mgnify:CR=1 FL=1
MNVLMCIGDEHDPKNLIEAAKESLGDSGGELWATYSIDKDDVMKEGSQRQQSLDQGLEYIYTHGAKIAFLRGNSIVQGLLDLSEKNKIDLVVITGDLQRAHSTFLRKLPEKVRILELSGREEL